MVGEKGIKNIIFIIADTLRADYLGVYNQKITTTPNIDKLAKGSAVFTNAYASITKTDPSITSIMSGKYPQSIGLIAQGRQVSKFQENNVSKILLLPEILKKNGFRTFALDWLGRWHKRGFDYYSGHLLKQGNPTHSYNNNIINFFRSQTRLIDTLSIKLFRRDLIVRSAYKFLKRWKSLDYDPANIVVDKSLEILRQKDQKKFLFLHFWDAHDPYMQHEDLKRFFLNDVKSNYAAEVKFIDDQIGRVIDFLIKHNCLDESLIIMTADHGENFYEHDTPLHHEGLYEDVVKVPLLIKSTTIRAQKVNSLVQHIDLFPTILEILGIPNSSKIDGISMLSLLNHSKKKIRDYVLFEDIVPKKGIFLKSLRRRGIRFGNFKYIETLSGGELKHSITVGEDRKILKQELYNLKKNPQEKFNLTKRKSLIQKLQNKLQETIYRLNVNHLRDNEALFKKYIKTTLVIKKAITKSGFNKIAIAWKGGKDTTVMMHIIKNMYGKIPFKVFFNDTTLEFKETYEYIKKMKNLWDLDLVIVKHDKDELMEYHNTKDEARKKELSRLMKITAINKALKKYKLKGFMLGIRRDENPARKNEKYFSKREDHIRIHPLLDWTEEDIWEYTKLFGIPYNKLYDQGYRSVGEKPFTQQSQGKDERSGRDQEKEQAMESLKKMGYW